MKLLHSEHSRISIGSTLQRIQCKGRVSVINGILRNIKKVDMKHYFKQHWKIMFSNTKVEKF